MEFRTRVSGSLLRKKQENKSPVISAPHDHAAGGENHNATTNAGYLFVGNTVRERASVAVWFSCVVACTKFATAVGGPQCAAIGRGGIGGSSTTPPWGRVRVWHTTHNTQSADKPDVEGDSVEVCRSMLCFNLNQGYDGHDTY